ncbi:hypothetical protein L596_020287 [Steinernema carpocapsae]|uniref:Uncharacterized protein n=1 Tax=Steinernema carpocapsae TaxID=34508 RepID=A0A4U5MTR1_STECR|nr:hypothetical protein L596_020287 [Steinernema carpocapsae]
MEAPHVNMDCSREPCKKFALIYLLHYYCFSMDGYDIAYGLKGLFDTLLVILKGPITWVLCFIMCLKFLFRKPELPTTSVAPTTQGIIGARGELLVNEDVNATNGTDSNSTTAVELTNRSDDEEEADARKSGDSHRALHYLRHRRRGKSRRFTIYYVVAHKREKMLEQQKKESSSAASGEATSQGLRKRTSI